MLPRSRHQVPRKEFHEPRTFPQIVVRAARHNQPFDQNAAAWRDADMGDVTAWVERTERVLRNAAVVARNVGATAAVPALDDRVRFDPEPLVREHALWALAGLDAAVARRAADWALAVDPDDDVRAEALRTLAATWIQIIPAEQSGPRIAGLARRSVRTVAPIGGCGRGTGAARWRE